MRSEQLGRIDGFIQAEPAPPVRLTIGFTSSDSALVLDRVRSVMRQVAEAQSRSWPNDDQWLTSLPGWLSRGFEGHPLSEILANSNLWDFGSWLDAMKFPGWEWWSSGTSDGRGVVECSAHAMPYAIEPLFFLLRVAGAEDIVLVEGA